MTMRLPLLFLLLYLQLCKGDFPGGGGHHHHHHDHGHDHHLHHHHHDHHHQEVEEELNPWLRQRLFRGARQSQQKQSHSQSLSSAFSSTVAGRNRNRQTGFSCRGRPPGYYADMDLDCEVYHLCNRHGGGMAFSCPEGTRFEQRTMVCHHSGSVKCQNSARFYDTNLRIGQKHLKLIDDDDNDIHDIHGPVMQLMVKKDLLQERPRTSSGGNNSNKKKAPFMQVVFRENNGIFTQQQQQHKTDTSHRLQQQQQLQHQQQQQRHRHDRVGSRRPFDPIFNDVVPAPANFDRGLRDAFPMELNPRRPPSAEEVTATTTPTPPGEVLTPPPPDAPVAEFTRARRRRNRQKQRRNRNRNRHRNRGRRKKKKKKKEEEETSSGTVVSLDRFLSSRDARRVVGVRPILDSAASAASTAPVMTLDDFLTKFPQADRIRAIPVPVSEEDAAAIHRLATQGGGTEAAEADPILGELDGLIAARTARRTVPPTGARPRGGGSRAANEAVQTTTASSPKLEFGFRPIVTTDGPPGGNRGGAFFFTTTTEAPEPAPQHAWPPTSPSSPSSLSRAKSRSQFDMRTLFFIPPSPDKHQHNHNHEEREPGPTRFFPGFRP